MFLASRELVSALTHGVALSATYTPVSHCLSLTRNKGEVSWRSEKTASLLCDGLQTRSHSCFPDSANQLLRDCTPSWVIRFAPDD